MNRSTLGACGEHRVRALAVVEALAVILLRSTVASPLLWAGPGELAGPPARYRYVLNAALDFSLLSPSWDQAMQVPGGEFPRMPLSTYFGE